MEAWAAIEPALPLVEHVHLQGWGEPLLHPKLAGMAEAAKAAGCAVGLTTNGDLLGGAIDWLVRLPLDLVSLSVGGGPTHHAALKDGSSLEEGLAAAGDLAAGAGKGGSPRVQVSFLLTRDNAGDLEEVIRLAARHRIREIFTIHLDCTPSPELLNTAAFTSSGLRDGVPETLAAASVAAARQDVHLRHTTVPEDVLVCALDPSRFVYVAVDGRVGPCAYLLLPIAGPIPRAGFAGICQTEPVSFGSVRAIGLVEILSSPARRRFVAPFAARLAAETAFRRCVVEAVGTAALAQLEEADGDRARALADNPFPPACMGCHKMVGW